MKWLKKWLHKLTILFSISIVSSMILLTPGYSQSAGDSGTTNYLLTLIVSITGGIFQLMNQLPAYANSLVEMAASWTQTNDPANTIGNNQYALSSLSSKRSEKEEYQSSHAAYLTYEFLMAGSFDPKKPSVPTNANDLTYTILLEKPKPIIQPPKVLGLTMPQPDYKANIINYINNVSASTLILSAANPNWPDSTSKTQYVDLYNTLSSIQSYDQYLITGLAYFKDTHLFSTLLGQQASDPNWFKQISTEALGLVLRHILMYVSQSFVEMTEIADLQQKQLAVQAMTNSLLIILVQSNVGFQLQRKASQGEDANSSGGVPSGKAPPPGTL